MPAKPNIYVVLQCRQVTFKGEGPNILKKDLYYYHYYYCNYYYSIIIIAVTTDNDDEISKNFWGCAKKVFKFKHAHMQTGKTKFYAMTSSRFIFNEQCIKNELINTREFSAGNFSSGEFTTWEFDEGEFSAGELS